MLFPEGNANVWQIRTAINFFRCTKGGCARVVGYTNGDRVGFWGVFKFWGG